MFLFISGSPSILAIIVTQTSNSNFYW